MRAAPHGRQATQQRAGTWPALPQPGAYSTLLQADHSAVPHLKIARAAGHVCYGCRHLARARRVLPQRLPERRRRGHKGRRSWRGPARCATLPAAAALQRMHERGGCRAAALAPATAPARGQAEGRACTAKQGSSWRWRARRRLLHRSLKACFCAANSGHRSSCTTRPAQPLAIPTLAPCRGSPPPADPPASSSRSPRPRPPHLEWVLAGPPPNSNEGSFEAALPLPRPRPRPRLRNSKAQAVSELLSFFAPLQSRACGALLCAAPLSLRPTGHPAAPHSTVHHPCLQRGPACSCAPVSQTLARPSRAHPRPRPRPRPRPPPPAGLTPIATAAAMLASRCRLMS